jgi:hypothetical protein
LSKAEKNKRHLTLKARWRNGFVIHAHQGPTLTELGPRNVTTFKFDIARVATGSQDPNAQGKQ